VLLNTADAIHAQSPSRTIQDSYRDRTGEAEIYLETRRRAAARRRKVWIAAGSLCALAAAVLLYIVLFPSGDDDLRPTRSANAAHLAARAGGDAQAQTGRSETAVEPQAAPNSRQPSSSESSSESPLIQSQTPPETPKAVESRPRTPIDAAPAPPEPSPGTPKNSAVHAPAPRASNQPHLSVKPPASAEAGVALGSLAGRSAQAGSVSFRGAKTVRMESGATGIDRSTAQVPGSGGTSRQEAVPPFRTEPSHTTSPLAVPSSPSSGESQVAGQGADSAPPPSEPTSKSDLEKNDPAHPAKPGNEAGAGAVKTGSGSDPVLGEAVKSSVAGDTSLHSATPPPPAAPTSTAAKPMTENPERAAAPANPASTDSAHGVGAAASGSSTKAPAPAGSMDLPFLSPVALQRTQPSYPEIARKQKISGVVRLLANVGADGSVIAVRIVGPVYPPVDKAAADAVKRWKYRPAQYGDRAVAAWVEESVTFKVE
jgi:protein TonB